MLLNSLSSLSIIPILILSISQSVVSLPPYAPIEYPPYNPPPDTPVWCGKPYRVGDASLTDLVEAGWLHEPKKSDWPLLEFICHPRLRPLIAGKASVASVVVVARVVDDVGTRLPVGIRREEIVGRRVWVNIKVGEKVVREDVEVAVGEGETEVNVDFDNCGIETGWDQTLSCSVSLTKGEEALAAFEAPLSYLPPNPYGGSTVQHDGLTGRLLVSGLPKDSALPTKFFPVGYYVGWGNFLKDNYTRLHDIKSDGFTMVHPIPGGGPDPWGFGSFEKFTGFLDAAEKAGLWVMYDMRHTYSNSSLLELQIKAFRDHPALLLWYTADEPDGHGDATRAPRTAYETVSTLDGYHPISLTPNCQNHFFASHASGADILAPDVYPIAVNTTFSTVYNTPCTRTHGCCGWDNGHTYPSRLEGLAARVLEMRAFARWTGLVAKSWWGVGQGFGAAEFWDRVPTHDEIVQMAVSAVEDGRVMGLLWWSQPTDAQVYDATKEVAKWVNGGRWLMGKKRTLLAHSEL